MGNRSSRSQTAHRLSEQEASKRRSSSSEFMSMENIDQVIDMCEWDFAQPTNTGMLAEAMQGFSAVRSHEKLFLDAESFLEQALSLLEKTHGKQHAVIAECLLDGGLARISFGKQEDSMRQWRGPSPISEKKFQEALDYTDQAMEIYEAYRGRDKTRHLVRCGIQRGDCYLLLRDGPNAVKTWQTAFEHCEQMNPVPEELMSLVLFGQACAARLQGDESHQHCLTLHVNALNALRATNNDKDVSKSLIEQAKINTDLNLHSRAIDALNQAVEICQAIYGEHEETADVLSLLGEAQYSNGEYSEASVTGDLALNMYESVLGTDNPKYAYAMANVGVSYYSLPERLDDAMQCYQKALSIFIKCLGDKHSSVGDTYNSIGSVWFAKKNSMNAMELYEKALKLYVDLHGQEHASVAIAYNNMASVRRMESRLREAAGLYRKSMDIRSKVLGQDHKNTGLTMNSLGEVELERKQYDEAMTMFTQARFILAKSLGPEHPTVAKITSNMGEASHGRGQYAAAMQNFSQSLDIKKKHLGENHPDVVATLRAMEQVHKQMVAEEIERERDILERRKRRTEAIRDDSSKEKEGAEKATDDIKKVNKSQTLRGTKAVKT